MPGVVGYDDPVDYSAPVPYSLPAGTTTLRLYEAVGPTMREGDADNGYPLLSLLDGPASLLDDVAHLVSDTEELPGWAALFDPAAVQPARLAWLAQLVGEHLVGDVAARRQQIAGRRRWARGTVGAVEAAVAATLTGTAEVDIDERTDGQPGTDRPYRFVVRTLTSQTPRPGCDRPGAGRCNPCRPAPGPARRQGRPRRLRRPVLRQLRRHPRPQ